MVSVPLALLAVLAWTWVELNLHRRVPAPVATLGALAEHCAHQDYRPWSRAEVRAVVRQTTADQIGIEPDFDDDARFIHDLGL